MIDLKTLSEMPSTKEMMQASKKPRNYTSTTVAMEKVPKDDVPEGMTKEEYDEAMKEFMEFSEMTPEQIEEMLDTMSTRTTSPIKESHPMTRREELETKGISQCMTERLAQGTLRGAFSKSTAFDAMADAAARGQTGDGEIPRMGLSDEAAIREYLRKLSKEERGDLIRRLLYTDEPAAKIGAKMGSIPGGDADDIVNAVLDEIEYKNPDKYENDSKAESRLKGREYGAYEAAIKAEDDKFRSEKKNL